MSLRSGCSWLCEQEEGWHRGQINCQRADTGYNTGDGRIMARSLSAMRLRSERISSAESQNQVLPHPVPAGWPARGQEVTFYQCCRNTSGVLGGVLNVSLAEFVVCGVRAFCHPALSATWRRCTPGAVCSVNNVIAYSYLRSSVRRYGRSSAGFPYRWFQSGVNTLDGDFENKRLFCLLVVWPTRRIRTGY